MRGVQEFLRHREEAKKSQEGGWKGHGKKRELLDLFPHQERLKHLGLGMGTKVNVAHDGGGMQPGGGGGGGSVLCKALPK